MRQWRGARISGFVRGGAEGVIFRPGEGVMVGVVCPCDNAVTVDES